MKIDESWYRRPPGVPEHTAAGGVVVRPLDSRLVVALIREGGQPEYVLPKGHIEPSESLEEAAAREVAEEAGLAGLTNLGEIAVRERLNLTKTSWKRTHYFLYVLGPGSGAPGQAEWFALDALPAMFWPEQRELLDTYRSHIVALVAQFLERGRRGDPSKQATQRQFGRRASAYAHSASHQHDADLDLLVEHLKPSSADHLLDVATGTGFTAVAFRPLVRSVVGADLTWEMLREAQSLRSGRNRIRWVVADADALPFADATFSLVTCRRAAHHFVDVEHAIREMLRVLAVGGRIGLVDQVPPDDEAARKLMESMEILRDPSHVQALPASHWQALLARSGVALALAQTVERRLTISEWLELAGTDRTRRDAIDAALLRASPHAREQIGYEATQNPTFLKRWLVLVGRK
ncbi:MAG TPA: methyltransferase domain-containing protein [bacterium]|nr:methyltransferase domain-containing protein [bacterium]